MFLMHTLRINITMLCLIFFFISFLDDKWGNIYESLAVVVFLQLGFLTAGAMGDMGFFFIAVHYMEQSISIPTRCGVSYGCCKYSLAYLTPRSSERSSLHKAIVPVHLRGM